MALFKSRLQEFLRKHKNNVSDSGASKIHQAPIYAIVASVFIIFSGIAYISCSIINSSVQDLESAKLTQLHKIGQDYIDMALQKSLARASIIAEMPAVVDLFGARKRDQLYDELKDLYKDQKNKYGSGAAQFIIPPAISFLRLHKPEAYGDDISFRPMILEALADQAPIKGISISRDGPYLYGVAPVKDAKGKFLGVFEMSQSFDMLATSLKNAYGIESAVFFDEELLEKNATQINREVFSDKNRFGIFVKLTSTNWDLISNLIESSSINSSKPIEPFTKDFEGNHYGVVVIPLLNPAGTHLGQLVLFNDLNINQAVAKKLCVLVWMFSLFGAVLISGVFLVVVKGGILKPLAKLSENMDLLATGQKPDPIDLHDYQGPVQSIARSYQELADKHQSDN